MPDGGRKFEGASWSARTAGAHRAQGLGIEFEGYTWPERFIVLTTLFDFEASAATATATTFRSRRVGEPVQGRRRRRQGPVARRLPDAERGERRGGAERSGGAGAPPALLPEADAVPSRHRNLYKVHQRVAATFRKGRVLLAGEPRTSTTRSAGWA